LQHTTTEFGNYALEEPIIIKARSWAFRSIRWRVWMPHACTWIFI